MQFKVPQFLDIEDKIFGPFTFRQFVYLAGGAGFCFIIFRLVGLYIGTIPIAIVAGFSLALAFYRPNNKPFIYMVEAGIKYLMQNKLYIWQKQKQDSNSQQTDTAKSRNAITMQRENKLTGSKLKDLAWSLDVLDLNKHSPGN